MNYLTHWETKSLMKAVERLCEDTEPESLPERMRSAVAMIIPSEANCLEIYDKNNHPTILGAYPYNFFSPESLEILGVFLDEHPLFEPINIQRKHTAVKISDFCSLTEFFRTNIYNEVYRKLNVANQLIVDSRINADEILTCCLSRGRRDFSESERLMLELLSPHLVNSFRRSSMVEKLRRPAENGSRRSEITRQNLRKLTLTSRETEVLVFLTKGKTDKEIAYLCRISPRTVHHHLQNIYEKLGVENRTSAVVRAMECLP